jgi:hypothetical protein
MPSTITIADLFPEEKGMILVAMNATDKTPRAIYEVPNGAACGCVCYGCGRRLIARNGGDSNLRAHSFAHYPEDMVIDCWSSGETLLHIRAKEIIAKHRRVTLPPTYTSGIDGVPVQVTPEQSVELTDVRLETFVGEVVPDVAANLPDGRTIFIEIANTHPCPDEKIEKLAEMGVEVLEIKVVGYRNIPLDELDDIVLDLAPRKMLLSSEVKAKADQIAEERKKLEAEKRAAAMSIVEVYRDRVIHKHKRAQELADNFVQVGLAEFIDIGDETPSAFKIYRWLWQAVILYKLYKAKSGVLTTWAIIEDFQKRGWPKPEISRIKSEYSKWIAANVAADFRSPYEEVVGYLARLQKSGAVFEVQGKGFALFRDLRVRIREADARRELPTQRLGKLQTIFENIGAIMLPEDGSLPGFDTWLQDRASILGLSTEKLLSDENGRFDELIAELDALKAGLKDLSKFRNCELPGGMAGLPLAGLIDRLGKARLEAQQRATEERARREAATTARLLKEADDRVYRIEEEASLSIANGESFLNTRLPKYDGKTPRELSRESNDGFKAARWELSLLVAAEYEAARVETARLAIINRLRETVYRKIVRRDKADLWMTQRWPDLGGVKPLDYCADEETFARCCQVLDDFVANEKKRARR